MFRTLKARQARQEAREFCAEARRRILQQTFTLGERDIPNARIVLHEVDALEIFPVDGHEGLADVWVRCSVTGEPQVSWLRARLVDRRISELHLAETSPPAPSSIAPGIGLMALAGLAGGFLARQDAVSGFGPLQ